MLKISTALAIAALIAGLIVAVPGLSGDVAASTSPTALAKGDRLDARTFGASCSTRGWPYFETQCLRDPMNPTRDARAVRIVTADRLR